MQPNTTEWPLGTAIELQDSRMFSSTDEGSACIRKFAVAASDPRRAMIAVGLPSYGERLDNAIVGVLNILETRPFICTQINIDERLGEYVWVISCLYRTMPEYGHTQTHVERAEMSVPYWLNVADITSPTSTGVQVKPDWREFKWEMPVYRITMEITVYLDAPSPGVEAWNASTLSKAVGQSNELHALPGVTNPGFDIDDDLRGPNWWFIGPDSNTVSRALGSSVTYSWTFRSAVNAPTFADIFGSNSDGVPNLPPSRMQTVIQNPPRPITGAPTPPTLIPNIVLPPSIDPWWEYLSQGPTSDFSLPTITAVDPHAKRRDNIRNPKGTGWKKLPGMVP